MQSTSSPSNPIPLTPLNNLPSNPMLIPQSISTINGVRIQHGVVASRVQPIIPNRQLTGRVSAIDTLKGPFEGVRRETVINQIGGSGQNSLLEPRRTMTSNLNTVMVQTINNKVNTANMATAQNHNLGFLLLKDPQSQPHKTQFLRTDYSLNKSASNPPINVWPTLSQKDTDISDYYPKYSNAKQSNQTQQDTNRAKPATAIGSCLGVLAAFLIIGGIIGVALLWMRLGAANSKETAMKEGIADPVAVQGGDNTNTNSTNTTPPVRPSPTNDYVDPYVPPEPAHSHHLYRHQLTSEYASSLNQHNQTIHESVTKGVYHQLQTDPIE